ncbi:unnamed protein product [Notodromas monacha]|uniref:Cytochrome b5 heme-binding domain-containing protein n=1 Tax=Notodromas monacha TaxID=399045 RepID=A0A7R9G844_9CRUS|nr:unnamed protein product [Notodromas monacha]CAD7284201.1 unnamed protein product [Notodromas monacha]CAG0912892.1 unnamed protein product [Notodromas monacha]CAG0924353.1 unnamed protein product [Notodromas monacha]
MSEEPRSEEEPGFMAGLIAEASSPLNLVLLVLCSFLIYRLLGFGSKKDDEDSTPLPPRLPRMKRRDFTVEELKEFDGVLNSEGRILVAVNGKVLDVSAAKQLYGPNAPYSIYAGRDASRGLAKFTLDSAPVEYDDLSDLNPAEMESLREWEAQLTERYFCVGKLLKPGEKPTEYFDEEDSPNKSKASSADTESKKEA